MSPRAGFLPRRRKRKASLLHSELRCRNPRPRASAGFLLAHPVTDPPLLPWKLGVSDSCTHLGCRAAGVGERGLRGEASEAEEGAEAKLGSLGAGPRAEDAGGPSRLLGKRVKHRGNFVAFQLLKSQSFVSEASSPGSGRATVAEVSQARSPPPAAPLQPGPPRAVAAAQPETCGSRAGVCEEVGAQRARSGPSRAARFAAAA